MPDIYKAIKGLECCTDSLKARCPECPYYPCYDEDTTSEKLLADALALLKEQEPRLVVKKDFENADKYGYLPVYVEDRDGTGYWDCITDAALGDTVSRFWTTKPTDEQRKAVK